MHKNVFSTNALSRIFRVDLAALPQTF